MNSILIEVAEELYQLAAELRETHTTPDGEWPKDERKAMAEHTRLRFFADELLRMHATLQQDDTPPPDPGKGAPKPPGHNPVA